MQENLVATAANRLKREPAWTLERVYALFPRLRERAGQLARTLSGGEQQMLAVGRALMTNPRLLILDEATEGLAPVIRAEIWRCIEQLKAEGQSILIVDKNLNVLKRLADRHFVIEKGRTVWTGTSAELDRDAELIHRFVGFRRPRLRREEGRWVPDMLRSRSAFRETPLPGRALPGAWSSLLRKEPGTQRR